MKSIREKVTGENAYFNILVAGDYEYVDPFRKYFEIFFQHNLNVIRSKSDLENTQTLEKISKADKHKFDTNHAGEEAVKDFTAFIKMLGAQPKPEKLLSLLAMTSKKDQVRVLKTISLTSNMLTAMIMESCSKMGYSYSMYTTQHHRRDLDEGKIPRIAYKEENGEILVIGHSDLTKGQIKSAIEQKKTTVARFIDNGENWHCFYYTSNSIGGKEAGGTAHIHYTSHLWGMSRAETLKQLRSRDYKLPGPHPHIPFEKYS